VWNGEGVYINVANRKPLPRLNPFGALQPLAKRVWQDALQRVHGRLGHIERRLPKPEDLRQAIAMVCVFVSDQDSVEAINFPAAGGQPRQRFAFP
jgi:hypothetical protein